MGWEFILLIFVGLLILLLILGIPVAFSFLITNFVCLYVFAGGTQSLFSVIPSSFEMMVSITMLAVPLFILMGEVIFHSGVGWKVMEAMDLWIGRFPARLSLLAVGGGTLFAMLSGSSIAVVSMLGSVLVPGMRQKNYAPSMCVGPIMAGGALALVIPPTFFGVIIATLAEVSIARLLIALIVPGMVMSALFVIYIIVRALLNPGLAPPYEREKATVQAKVKSLLQIFPLAGVIFLVTGVIFFGIATPTEAAALGALGAFALAMISGTMNLSVFRKMILQTGSLTCAVFMIIIGSTSFSQLLAYTGASKALVSAAVDLPLHPIILIIIMQLCILLLGTFMDQFSIMMITVPVLAPMVAGMGFDLVWFCAITLMNLCIAGNTPPFGLHLFAMKSVVPEEITMMQIIRAAIPYVLLGLIGVAIVICFPGLALWLPSLIAG
ncbi:MAG: TRAP transporter large permease subunit [Deltaproteobacteria bacterium]|nr:TRAP transporter large permease subunit [Deltaproteobacteria bacterium]